MKFNSLGNISALLLAMMLFAAAANAQWGTPNAYGYNTGYGAVYGTFQQAALMQSMYNVARSAQLNGSRSSTGTTQAQNKTAIAQSKPVPAIVKNYGAFRPDPTVDTATLMADSLGSTPEEKILIKQIFASTKAFYEKEAAAKGWKNNIAGGLTFFTASAVTVYHDVSEPDAAGLDAHYKSINASIDQIPEFASMPNRDKQGFQNMMIGFGGMLLAVYSDGKENGNAETIANSKKLAGMLIEMVLKADPENIRVENGRIVYR
jgi:hypothetical protein